MPVEEFYRHLMPDQPGPAKLRQLLVWCTQSWLKRKQDASTNGKKAAGKKGPAKQQETILGLAERFSQALASHEFNTSWYQRPISESVTINVNNYLGDGQDEEPRECRAGGHSLFIRALPRSVRRVYLTHACVL